MKQVFSKILKLFRRSRLLSFTAKASLTLLAFWIVFSGIDFNHLAEIAREQNKSVLIEAFGLLFCQLFLGAVRWHIIINALAKAGKKIINLWEVFKFYYISGFFNSWLPGGAVSGDVFRVWLLKSEAISMPLAINSVVIDRMVALGGLGLMVLMTLPWLAKIMGFDATLVFVAVAVTSAVGVWVLFNMDRILLGFQHIRLARWALHLIQSIKLLLTHPVAFTQTAMLAMLAHSSFCIAAYILARSLNIEITLLQSLTLVPAVILITTLPISVGGWGIREAGLVGMLSLIAVPSEAALILSIELGVMSVLLSLPGGILWLLNRKHSEKTPENSIILS